jgi:pyruvate,water dikinase
MKGNKGALTRLMGIAASPGRARGPAAVVRSWSEIDRVMEGSILIARTTEPDMVSAFFKVRGVVTDLGGATSHAATNARELGLPCVVGVGNATDIISPGDMVTVDGHAGEVSVEKT